MNEADSLTTGVGNFFLGQEYPRRGVDADHSPEVIRRRQPSPKLNGETLVEQQGESGWGFTKRSQTALHYFEAGRSLCHGSAPSGKLLRTTTNFKIACPACLSRWGGKQPQRETAHCGV